MKVEKRILGFWDVFSITAGTMISSGLFILPSLLYNIAGEKIIISYALAGLFLFPALISQLELSSAIPKAGGTFFHIQFIMGPAAGMITGLSNWFMTVAKSAFAAVGMGAFLTVFFPEISDIYIKLGAIVICLFFTFLNLISVKSSGIVQTIFVFALLIILLQYILIGYRVMDVSHIKNIFKGIEFNSILATTSMAFISYGGILKTVNMAEEVKDLRKNLIKGTLWAFWVVEFLYVAVVAVTIGILPPSVMRTTLLPISKASSMLFSNIVFSEIEFIGVSIATALAFLTTVNAGIMTASRIPFAMSMESMLPEVFSRESRKFKVPYFSVLFTSAIMIIMILFTDIEKIAKIGSFFMLVTFILVNVALIMIRISRLANYKPSFKAVLFPVIQILSILIYCMLIFEMGSFIIVTGFLFFLFSFILYFFYARGKTRRKSALVRMVKSLSLPDVMGDESAEDLEMELLNILIERNEIVEDRFDEVIRKALVIDYERTVNIDEFFGDVSELISKKWNINKEEVFNKFKKREEDSPTLIYPGVAVPHAIPHIMVEGNGVFDMVIVRNKYGIKWNNDEVVYTAFVMISSKDERNFHLKALMALAQILQNENFYSDWMKAKNQMELKTVLILAKRSRWK